MKLPSVLGRLLAAALPAGNKLFLVGHAVAVQIYQCNATATGHRWGLVAPRADLYDDKGKRIATTGGLVPPAEDHPSCRQQTADDRGTRKEHSR